MKKLFTFSIALASFFVTTNAQTAMQISGLDCYDNSMDMFADLDAGKAVILHFYMPDCGSCPPPATKIQTMANLNRLYQSSKHRGQTKYAMLRQAINNEEFYQHLAYP